MTRVFRTTLIAALSATPPLIAGQALADGPSTPLGEVVVTATRLPEPQDITPGAYVIDSKEIEIRQAEFAKDVLADVPGLTVFSDGAYGGLTSVQQRGTTSDKTLVVIDGVPVNDPSSPEGGFDFGNLDMADVSRIEVLSGPQSSLWGSDAIGGVISITTKDPNGLRIVAEGGSYDTSRVSLAAGQTTDRWSLGLTASNFATKGISAADVRNDYAPYGDPALHNSEPDGVHDWTLGGRAKLVATDWLTLDGQIRYVDSHGDTDGYPFPSFLLSDTNDTYVTRSTEGFVRAHFTAPTGWTSDASYSRYQLARAYGGEDGGYGYTAHRDVYRWTAQHGGVDDVWSVLAGVEHNDTEASLSTGANFDLGGTSGFVVGRWRPLTPLTATASVRYDALDKFGGHATARGGLAYALGGGFSLTASIGQGFKAPTISEEACDFCFPTGPSVGLRPEKALGYDAGGVWRSADDRYSARLTFYQIDTRDLISYGSGRYVNVARARSQGAEFQAEAALGAGFRLKGSYSYTDAIDLSTGERLLRVPLHAGSASLFWSNSRADAALTVRSEADAPDAGLDGFTPVVRPGFVVADLTGSVALTDHLRLTGRIENLGGVHYQEVYGCGEPRRAVFVGFRWVQ